MSANARLTRIDDDLTRIERELEAQEEAWSNLGPELARAGQTQLWVESLPETEPTPKVASTFLAGVRG